jgi:hypothetical protein
MNGDSRPLPSARYGLSASDRALLARITIVVALGFLFIAAVARIDLLYSHKFFDRTGRAEWIWPPLDVSLDDPVAFFATRNFDLPPNRYYTHIKVSADPEYTLTFNGREIGGRRAGEESVLDVYDVTALARDRDNRIVIAVRSTKSVGGLIAAVDLSPEVENFIVTDRAWKIVPRWTPELALRDPAVTVKPALIGQPPIGRWNYLKPADRPLEIPPTHAIAPRSSVWFTTALPEIRDTSGVAIVSKHPQRATAYDFGGFVDGRLRVTRRYNLNLPEVVNVRFANAADELKLIEAPVRPFVFAAGETTVVDTEVRHFRYASVYGRPAKADVLQ